MGNPFLPITPLQVSPSLHMCVLKSNSRTMIPLVGPRSLQQHPVSLGGFSHQSLLQLVKCMFIDDWLTHQNFLSHNFYCFWLVRQTAQCVGEPCSRSLLDFMCPRYLQTDRTFNACDKMGSDRDKKVFTASHLAHYFTNVVCKMMNISWWSGSIMCMLYCVF